jgi:hypothetical protein
VQSKEKSDKILQKRNFLEIAYARPDDCHDYRHKFVSCWHGRCFKSSLAADISKFCKIKSDILNIAFPILSIVLALLVGSVFPKTLARYNAEKIGIAVLPAIIKFATVF